MGRKTKNGDGAVVEHTKARSQDSARVRNFGTASKPFSAA